MAIKSSKKSPRKPRAYSPIQKQWAKERKRINDFIRRAKKRGYTFPDFKMPEMPKRVTEASLRRMRKYNAEWFYKHGQFVDTKTGEVVSATEGRKIERRKSAYKSAITKAVRKMFPGLPKFPIAPPSDGGGPEAPARPGGESPSAPPLPDFYDIAYRNLVLSWAAYSGLPGYQVIMDWLRDSVLKYGTEAVLQAIWEAENDGYAGDYAQFYTTASAVRYIANVSRYFVAAGIADQGEIDKVLSDISDYTEDGWDYDDMR